MTMPLPPMPMMMEEEPEGLEALRESGPPATSDERDESTVLEEDLGIGELDEIAKRGLADLYGAGFPLLKDTEPEDEDWASWAEELWKNHESGIQTKLRMVERNRLFRKGVQWITSMGGGPWKEPPKPKDAARIVDNMIAPALDQRIQLVSEQRPGFKARPATRDPNDLKKAEAQQFALEYQYDQQNMRAILREAEYWAGTDGVSFIELYWDPERGPWDDVPAGEGQPMVKKPMGDVRAYVRRIEQVRVSSDASACRDPWYWLIKETIPLRQAIRDYGLPVATEADREKDSEDISTARFGRMGYPTTEPDELMREQETVDQLTVYCEKSEYLPNGLMLKMVGRHIVIMGPLLCGTCPLIRFTDGSSDPAFYPVPIMDGWLDTQMRINAVKSKWTENIRFNATARLLTKQNAIVGETLVAGSMSNIEFKGLGGLSELVRPIEGFSIQADAERYLANEIARFEQLSGWNDVSRGQFSAETSGRAILAMREQLERVFAPVINAAAEAMTKWAKVTIGWMAYGYDVQRTVGVTGSGRPDLARALKAEDFDGTVDVWIDPETMMPLPTSLRQFLLDNMLQQGIITPQEYRRRQPFSWVGSISTPDDDQEARARRCAEALRSGQELPILWQDNEAIHQDVLERELLLPDDTDPVIRMMANQRWMMLAQQASMKMMNMPQPMQQGGNGAGGEKKQMSPQTQPLSGTNPSVSAPAKAGAVSDQERTTKNFESNRFTPQ